MTAARHADLVVIGAHPLDAEILGGAISAQLANRGGRSVLVHLTDGAGNYPALGAKASSDRARSEAEQAAEILGTEICWLGIPSRELHVGAPFRDLLARRLESWQPHALITHWRGSWHERHVIAHRLVLRALGEVGAQASVYYGENFEDLDGFRPTHYVDIAGARDTWWRALECYRLYRNSRNISPEDNSTFPYYSYYRAAPRVRGLECGLSMAQAFAVSGRGTRRKTVATIP